MHYSFIFKFDDRPNTDIHSLSCAQLYSFTMTSSCQPSLPPLYFEERSATRSQEEINTYNSPELPAEILSLCLANFANWGDLAKLACVQKSWSKILMDASEHSISSKWELAKALLEGKCGLAKNPDRAFSILKELANVKTNDDNKPYEIDEGKTCFSPAMKKISDC